MKIQDMHYDFKKKFNKIDSQKNRNFVIPEIDWALNEAMDIFIDSIAFPRVNSPLAFEKSQRTIDDIRTIVIDPVAYTPVTNNILTLPTEYKHYVKGSGRVKISKGKCKDQVARLSIKKHIEMFEENSFYNSSFEWREVNGVFNSTGILLYTDGTFTIEEAKISYIKQPKYMHNAADFNPAGYVLPSGVALAGRQDCELPVETHREVVDIAVMIASGEVQTSNYQAHLAKLKMNQIV
jgi:hypothetical protein